MQSLAGVKLTKCPQNWQIIQRNQHGSADIYLEGTWSTFDWFPKDVVFTVQARVVSEQTNAPVTAALDWQDARMESTSDRFEITLRDIPQGGLYRIETRIRRSNAGDRRGLRGDCVHHLGVGDLYVIAGQSNAAGTGKGIISDGPQLGVHLFANDENWKLASHPLEDSTNSLHPITVTGINHGHSPWLAFAKAVYQNTGIPIGLIPTAVGGSSISRWVRDDARQGDLLVNMEDMIAKAGGHIAGVLWYQGESDANADGVTNYHERFQTFVQNVRAYVGNSQLPILIGQLNRWLDNSADDASWSRIREYQRQAALNMENVSMVVTIDCAMSDAIHNSAPSNVVIGERFAMVALQNIYKHKGGAAFPRLRSARFVNQERATVQLEFEQVSGEWMYSSEVPSDFVIEDRSGLIPIDSILLEPTNHIRIVLSRSAVEDAVVHGLYGANPTITIRDDLGRCVEPFSVSITEY